MYLKKYKKIISRIMLPLGVTLQRVPPLRRMKFFKKDTAPLYIEFVGASAVGKTTLYRKLYRWYGVEWIDIKHFVTLHADKLKGELYNLAPFYQDLASWRINDILTKENAIRPIEQLGAFRTAYSIIREDALIYQYNTNDIILSEEGLFQFFSGGIDSLFDNSLDEFKKLLRGRAMVHCYASVEVIAERIQKRQEKSQHLWFGHKVATSEELFQVIQRSLDEKRELINRLKKFIPVLEINTEDSLISNEKKIRDFISTTVKAENRLSNCLH